MDTPERIISAIDDFLDKKNQAFTTPKEIAPVLEKQGILKDRPDRSGLPLRNFLRAGKIPHAFQKGQLWRIPHSRKKSISTSKLQGKASKKIGGSTFFSTTDFIEIKDLDWLSLNQSGLYFIRLKSSSFLPEKYQTKL